MTQVGLEFVARNRAGAQTAAFRRSIGGVKRSMQGLMRAMLPVAGAAGFGYLMKSMIATASTAEETRAKFNTVFRDLAGDAVKWAREFGDSVGRASHDVESWMAGLQDTFVPLGIARDRAAELSKSLVTLAVDVASFNDKADAEVIRDFTSALVGNHETVRKYGIIISESAIRQEALNRGLDKTFSELTDLEKVQLRYALIQSGTTDAQGDAIRTGESYANQVKRLSANWAEFKVLVGGSVLPVLADLLSSINSSSGAIRRWASDTAEGFNMVANAAERAWKYLRWTPGPLIARKAYGWLKQDSESPQASAAPEGRSLPVIRPVSDATWGQTIARLQDDLKKSSAETVVQKAVERGKADQAAAMPRVQLTADQTRAIIEQRDMMARHMDEMIVYQQEVLARVREAYKVTQEYAAGFMRRVEDDFVTLWDPFIDGTKSAQEAMRDFFSNFFVHLAQAQAQMAMMRIWDNAVGPAVAGFAGALFGAAGGVSAKVAHGGGMIEDIATRRTVPISAFAGATQLHDGLGANEFPAILERGERVTRKGGGEPATYIGTYIERVDATDQASFEAQMYRSRHTIGDLQMMNAAGNHPSRRTGR